MTETVVVKRSGPDLASELWPGQNVSVVKPKPDLSTREGRVALWAQYVEQRDAFEDIPLAFSVIRWLGSEGLLSENPDELKAQIRTAERSFAAWSRSQEIKAFGAELSKDQHNPFSTFINRSSNKYLATERVMKVATEVVKKEKDHEKQAELLGLVGIAMIGMVEANVPAKEWKAELNRKLQEIMEPEPLPVKQREFYRSKEPTHKGVFGKITALKKQIINNINHHKRETVFAGAVGLSAAVGTLIAEIRYVLNPLLTYEALQNMGGLTAWLSSILR